LNHEKGGEITTNYDFEKQVLESYAVRDFKKGEELKIFYGPRPNLELFMNSGFVIPDNEFNYTAIHFKLTESDKLRDKKVQILQNHNLPENAKFAMHVKTPLQEELLSFLRVAWITNDEELDNAEYAFQNRPITLQNEMLVCTILEFKINSNIDSFSSKLEDDKKQLATQTMNLLGAEPGADLTILQLLIDEKSILTEALRQVRKKRKR